MKPVKIEDLPERVRVAVEAKLRNQLGAPGGNLDASARAAPPKAVAAASVRRGPNKTEAEYGRLMLGGKGRYEAVTLRLPGGSRYTPDWVTFEQVSLGVTDDYQDGTCVSTPPAFRITLHEVKGSYRLGSHGRALTAFREAVAAFPFFEFVWAVRKGAGDWIVKSHNNRGEATDGLPQMPA